MARLREKYLVLAKGAQTQTTSHDPGTKLDEASKFGDWLHTTLISMETDVSYLQEQLKDMLKAQTTIGQHISMQQITNDCMHAAHLHLITSRLFSAQHQLLLKAAGAGLRSQKGSSNSDTAGPISVASVDTDIHQLVEDTAEDCRAFCIEKNGEAPDVEVWTLPPYVELS